MKPPIEIDGDGGILAVIDADAGLPTERVPVGHPDRELVDEIEAALRRATERARERAAPSSTPERPREVSPISGTIEDRGRRARGHGRGASRSRCGAPREARRICVLRAKTPGIPWHAS